MKTVRELLKDRQQRQVWSVSPRDTVFEALALMGEKEIGALMVMDNDSRVVGIFTERDYARKIILKGKTSRETFVEEVMTPADKMFSIKPDTTVDECMVLMTGKHVRHLPVFEGGTFVGLVSIGDVVKSIIAEQETLIEHLSSYIAGKYT